VLHVIGLLFRSGNRLRRFVNSRVLADEIDSVLNFVFEVCGLADDLEGFLEIHVVQDQIERVVGIRLNHIVLLGLAEHRVKNGLHIGSTCRDRDSRQGVGLGLRRLRECARGD
jgi:hypothetical protein